MSNVYTVKGVNPLGGIVEVQIVADTAVDAKAKAEDVGLKFVVVTEASQATGPKDHQPDRRSTGN